MIILDLALQGFRELSGSMRVRLQSGYNALVSPSLGAETLVQGLLALLFADQEKPIAKVAKSGGGVSLMAADGTTLRAVRDFAAGSGQLFEFDKATRAFKPLATDLADIHATLKSRLGLPSRDAFAAVFVLKPRDLPSASKIPESKPVLPEPPPADPEVLRKRLTELDKILADLKAVEALEFELDGLQKQRFDCEDKVKALAFDDSELKAVEAEARRQSYVDVLPPDFLSRHAGYQKLVERRDADLKRWEAEREGLERAQGQTSVAPLAKDVRLWTGLLVGALAVAVAFAVGGIFRYVAFLDIPAFGVAALIIFLNLNEREVRDRVRFRLRLSDDRRQKILSRDAVEIETVEGLLKATGLAGADEVRRALAERAQTYERLTALKSEAERARNNPETARLVAERDKVAARIAGIEEKLAAMAALPVDAAPLRIEAESLRVQLARIKPPTAPTPAPASTEEKAALATWFRLAQDLLLSDPDTAARTLSERASLIIRALSGNRIVAVVFDASGDVFMRTTQGGSAKWAAMPDSARDLVYLALRGALYLALDPKLRAPVVSYGLAGVLAGGQEVEGALLATLAQAGQLIQIVRRAEEAPKAKHVAMVEVGP